MTNEEQEKTLWEVCYQTIWEMWLEEIQDEGIKQCLNLLRGYLVEMLE